MPTRQDQAGSAPGAPDVRCGASEATPASRLEGFAILGPDGRYRHLNSVAEQQARRPASELLGRHLAEAWPGVEATPFFAGIRACLEQGTPSCLVDELTFPDGRRGWFEMQVEPLPDGVLILSRDVTDRVRRDAAERRSRSLLDAIRRVNQLIVREKDPARLAQQACDLLAAPGEGVTAWIALAAPRDAGSSVLEAGWGERFESFRRYVASGSRPNCWAAARDGAGAFATEGANDQCGDCPLASPAARRPGIVVPLLHRDADFGTLGICLAAPAEPAPDEIALVRDLADDIALALHGIRSERERSTYRQLVAGSGDAMALIDREFTYIEVNPAYAQAWGIDASTTAGRPVVDVVGEAFFERIVRPNVSVALRGEAVEQELVVPAPGRPPVPMRVRVTPDFAPDGSVAAVSIIMRDISVQKRTEERLQGSEERFRAVFEESPVGVVLTRLDSGAIVEINPAFATMHGYTPAEMTGKSFLDLGVWDEPSDRERLMSAVARDGRCRGFEIRSRHRNGSLRTLRLSVDAIEAAGERYLLGVAEDITDFKLAEQRLRESQARLTAIYERSPFGILLARSRDGAILEVNETFARSIGWSVDEMLHSTTVALGIWAHPEQRARLMAELDADGCIREMDLATRRRDGTTRMMRVAMERFDFGGEHYVLTLSQDVTERLRDEAALRRQDELLREVARVAKIGGWEMDPVTGALIWTAGTADLHDIGRGAPETVPHALARYTEESRLRLEAAVRAAREQGAPYDLVLELEPTKSGRRFLRTVSHPVVEDGRVVRIWGSLQDVTDQVESDAQRRQLEEQLRASQKLEAIGTLAGGVAHDFNNLLLVILNYADFALQALREGDPLRNDIVEIRKAGERAATLTRQLLAFGRRQVLAPAALSLNQAAEGLATMLRRLVGEDIELAFELDGAAGVVMADPGQVEQVVMNLVLNARDAMPRGGRLTIATRNVEVGPGRGWHPADIAPGPYVEMSVTDTGVGMDVETRSRIFEPFFTTKEKGRGTGLGLATVYGIVKQSGGYILVESERGAGTVMRVRLPRELARHAEVPPAAPATRSGGTETVLVVEDEPALRDLVRRVLAHAGYAVLTASGLDEALSVVSRLRGGVNLLLTDVVMPQAGGLEVAQALTQRWPELRVLFMSGYPGDRIAHYGVAEAGRHFVAKPFTSAELLVKVRAALDDSPAPAPGAAAHHGAA